MTSHDDEFVREFATRVIVLADGLIVEEGDPNAVLVNPQHPATRALLT
jgi:polar amino acid transport system ATP-binding protein